MRRYKHPNDFPRRGPRAGSFGCPQKECPICGKELKKKKKAKSYEDEAGYSHFLWNHVETCLEFAPLAKRPRLLPNDEVVKETDEVSADTEGRSFDMVGSIVPAISFF